jgi:hypothetical protein
MGAYFTPPGGDVTAAYARSLMGGGMTYYAPSKRRDLNGLGALRFNRAVARGMYQSPFVDVAPRRRLGGLGCGGCRRRPSMSYYSRRFGRGLNGLGADTDPASAGTSLTYSATWNMGTLLQDYMTVVNSIRQNLASQGIVIDGQSGRSWYQSGYGVNLTVHTTQDFGSAGDVRSIIDHWIYQASGGGQMPQSSIATTALAQPQAVPAPGTPAGSLPPAPPPPAPDLATWVSNNWPMLALGVGGIVAIRSFS